MTLQQRGLDRLALAQSAYDQQILAPQVPENAAFVERYDATVGKYVVRSESGNRYSCLLQSTGAAAIGDKVLLIQATSGQPYIDIMPK